MKTLALSRCRLLLGLTAFSAVGSAQVQLSSFGSGFLGFTQVGNAWTGQSFSVAGGSFSLGQIDAYLHAPFGPAAPFPVRSN